MKRIVCIVLFVLIVAASLAACGNKVVSTGTTGTEAADAAEKETAGSDVKATGEIDVDLTTMSSTMVYSEVQNMMLKPTDYVGKTVKMHGSFSVAEIENNRYFACIIKDATACCSQGIEFQWAGSHSYPDDYPEQGKDITVTGTFNTYKEGEQVYCQLENADVRF